MHDAFVAVWRKIDRFDPERGSLRAWLMTVVRNRAIDRVRGRRVDRRRRRRRRALPAAHRPQPDVGGGPRRASASEVRAAMAELPDEQRRAVELAYFEGYTYREVAQITSVAPGTANGRLRLALGKLRETLGRRRPPLRCRSPSRSLSKDPSR